MRARRQLGSGRTGGFESKRYKIPTDIASQGRPAFKPGMTREQVEQAVQDWLKRKPDDANFDVYNAGNNTNGLRRWLIRPD
jgi:hypothetical protein